MKREEVIGVIEVISDTRLDIKNSEVYVPMIAVRSHTLVMPDRAVAGSF